jgi:DNA-binding XRE family transcriptional regulator
MGKGCRLTGAEFKAARKAMGLSVSQLADILDVNRSTIFRIEQTFCTRVMELAMERLLDTRISGNYR